MRQVTTSRPDRSAGHVLRGPIIAIGLFAGLTAPLITPARGLAQVPTPSPLELPAGAASTESDNSREDGPYILLQPDSSVVVMYMRDGVLERQTLPDMTAFRSAGVGGAYIKNDSISRVPPEYGQLEFKGVSRVFAVSDVHGDYESLVEVLQNGGVLDKDLHWNWGNGHLVVLGDVFDRGDRVNECLWLIHRLEDESQRAGGRVHYLLGNHELMVLRGDYRYVHPKYLTGIVTATGIEYKDMYGTGTLLGRWLRSKNTVVKINGVLFVHGGITPLLAEREVSLKQIDDGIRSAIDEAPSALRADTLGQFLLGRQGPLWYRGYLQEIESAYPQASCEDIEVLLKHYDATTVVVGHSEVGEIHGWHDGRVMTIDVPVEELGGLQALLLTAGRFYRIEADGDTRVIE